MHGKPAPRKQLLGELEFCKCIGKLVQPIKDMPEVGVTHRKLLIYAHTLPKGFGRLFQRIPFVQCNAEVVVRCHQLRIELDRRTASIDCSVNLVRPRCSTAEVGPYAGTLWF